MDLKKIKKATTLILEGIGENPQREGLKDTPTRVAEFYKEFFSEIKKDPAKEIKLYSTSNQDEMIIVKDITFYSLCEHHLLPFFGKAHIAYIPDKDRITGFSCLARIVETLSKRPQLQERLTTEIADILIKVLSPKGVLVILEAEHLCLTMRGVKKPGTLTVTSARRGVFRDNAIKEEAFALIKGN